MSKILVGIIAVLTPLAAPSTLSAAGVATDEVWAIDQSNSPGKTYGGTLYIWDGHDLESPGRRRAARAEAIDLSADAAALCFAKTGANPVRTGPPSTRRRRPPLSPLSPLSPL